MRKQYHHRRVGDDTHLWDVHRLVRLSRGIAPVMVPLTDIAEVDENWWYAEPGAVPTPRSFADHMILVRDTDLAHPIILCAEGRLMDGMHRVVKALSQGQTKIKAVRFPVTPDPDFINVALSDLPYPDEEI